MADLLSAGDATGPSESEIYPRRVDSEFTSNTDELIVVCAEIIAEPQFADRESLMMANAVTRAAHGFKVFPLHGKIPAASNPHSLGSAERRTCRGECGVPGHGVWDASSDVDRIYDWWTGPFAGCNIGWALPQRVFALDADVRKPGHTEAAQKIIAEHGPWPETLMTVSGRMDGGWHRFYRYPGGKLSPANMGPGFDVKAVGGYVVLPPSIHPDTGLAYVQIDLPIANAPAGLLDLLHPELKPRTTKRCKSLQTSVPRLGGLDGFFADSIADDYSDNTTWEDVLEPHGWRCASYGGGNEDGAVWLHPTHTSSCSATIRHGLLFVYSTNTPFEPTAAGDANGYTRFRAFAVLNHGGDMSAAARTLRQLKRVAG